MKALDLFCNIGGAGMGLYRAGFEVTGVDIEPQPDYPFNFIQADAMTFPLDGYDFIWASPPCQGYSWSAKRWINSGDKQWPTLIKETREMLDATGLPYIIENVVGAPVITQVMLCGTMFGLKLLKHRYFESNYLLQGHYHSLHTGSVLARSYFTVAGHGGNGGSRYEDWVNAMGIDWLTTGTVEERKHKLAEAIPPAYSEYLGKQIMNILMEKAA